MKKRFIGLAAVYMLLPARAEERCRKEATMMDELRGGRTTMDLFGLDERGIGDSLSPIADLAIFLPRWSLLAVFVIRIKVDDA
jgi:hypothetical protein